MSSQFLDTFLIVVMVFLAIAFFLCILRSFVGPRFTDRLVGVNMTNSFGIGFVCILAVYLEETSIIDIAVVYTMLSFLAITILSRVVILHHKGRLLHMKNESNDKEEKK